MKVAAIVLACLVASAAIATPQPIFPFSSGEYEFKLIDAEYEQEVAYPAHVTIEGTHIKVVVISSGGPFHRGQLIADGTIWWHQSGQWIVASSPEDFDAEEVGGCSGGPFTIDVQRRAIWFC